MKIETRYLKPQDREPLRQLLRKIDAFDEEDHVTAMELINIAIESPEQKDYLFILAGSDEGSCIGYACYGPTPLTQGTYDLYWIAVDPAWARQGIGTRLLRAVEEVIREARGRMMVIETSSSERYERTRHFYLKNGYHLEETIPDFYQPGENRVTYIKRFTQI